MTLRTTAVIAGVLGLLMVIAGLIAQAVKPDHSVVTGANLDTPVVVLGPQILALDGLERIAVTANGRVEARTARPVDAEAWLTQFSGTYVSGYAGWDALATRTASRVVPAEVSPSPTAPTATATASPSPSPTADGASSDQAPAIDFGSEDVWRESWNGVDRVSVADAQVPVGEYLVVHSADGSNLKGVELSAEREVNDAWISPLIWIGAALVLLGLIAVVSGIVDVRPAQERVEKWRRRRLHEHEVEHVQPGSRRERRLAGSTLPSIELDEVDAPPVASGADETRGDQS